MRKWNALLIAVVLGVTTWAVAQGGKPAGRAMAVKLQGALSPMIGRTVSWGENNGKVWLTVNAKGSFKIEAVGEDYIRLGEIDRPTKMYIPFSSLKGLADG